jgi:hypothetical protein
MIPRSVRLQVEELGSRILPSVTALPASSHAPAGLVAAASTPAASRLSISAPSSVGAGAKFTVTVTALDQSGHRATGYSGVVHFTSSDATAVLPANGRLVNGVGTFTVQLRKAGAQTLTVKDTARPALTGTSGAINVSPGAASKLSISAPSTAGSGLGFRFTVTALDQFGNKATNYGGTVHFSSSDGTATLPANARLNSGTGTFTATLRHAGSQTITATDTARPALTRTSGTINVLAAGKFTGSGQGQFMPRPTRSRNGLDYVLMGTAHLGGLGNFTLRGSLNGPPFNGQGQPTGTLVLSSGGNSLTLELAAPAQRGSSPLPSVFQYRVTSGTGIFQQMTDSGAVQLSLTFGTGIAGSGTFSLLF